MSPRLTVACKPLLSDLNDHEFITFECDYMETNVKSSFISILGSTIQAILDLF